jgi:hypothetical protein
LQRIWAQLSHSERQTCGFLSLSMCIDMVCFNSLTSRCHSWTWLDNCIWQVFIKGTCFFSQQTEAYFDSRATDLENDQISTWFTGVGNCPILGILDFTL